MCNLLTRKAVQECIWKALEDEYAFAVDDKTSLRKRTGLGVDDQEIRNNMYDVVDDAVKAEGCQLTALTPAGLVRCKTVGDIVTAVLDDIISH